jgi:uncharacterized protein YlxW (UPF0749 family)
MVRLTLSHQVNAVLAVIGKRTVAILAVAAALTTLSAQAVTRTELDNTQAQIQTLNQSIRASDARIAALEKDIWAFDRQIQDTRKQVREERLAGRKQVFDARRELKRQEFEIERIEKDIAVVDADIDVVNRNIARDKQRFAELNVLKQSLEEGEFKKRQEESARQLTLLNEKKAPLIAELSKAQSSKSRLQELVTSMESEVEDSSLDNDPRLAALLQKRDRASTELVNLRNQNRNDRGRVARLQDELRTLNARYKQEQLAQQARLAAAAKPAPKPAPVAPVTTSAPAVTLDRTDYGSYVFVISGDQEPDIEQTLHLKNWVESYGAKYIQASWNGFNNGNGPRSTAGFKEAFRSYIRQIPKDAKIVVAFSESRTIDFLAVLDPIGEQNLRANIVYKTDGACTRPDTKDEMTNFDYVACIKSAQKRMITGNIKYFYNRWQKDAQGPLDYQRQIPSLDSNGKVVHVPTATGRFEIAENTGADQKRLFFAGDKNAHRLLLTEEAKQLPKLLVQHLR